MARPTLLTPERHKAIVAAIRAGSFDWIAAEANGIDRQTFKLWMRKGQRHKREPYFSFVKDVKTARAQARLSAEIEVRKDQPFNWLRFGPGREREGEEGWTESSEVRHTGAVAVMQSQEWTVISVAIEGALEPFPEAKLAVAEAMRNLASASPTANPLSGSGFPCVATSTLRSDFGLNLIRETTSGNNTDYVFGPSIDEPLAIYASGAVSYLNADALGSVVATNSSAGAVSHSSVFDVWGLAKSETGTRVHPFTYTGRETGEGGLHFYRARWMQPAAGRFVSVDPIGFLPPYSYLTGRPMVGGDPLGLFPLPDCAQRILGFYFPDLDLKKVDIEFGLPWYVKKYATIDAKAVTIGNTIYFKTPSEYDADSAEGLKDLAHELQHVRQYKQLHGRVFFGLRYLSEYKRGKRAGLSDDDAYANIELELEANDVAEPIGAEILNRMGKVPCCPKPDGPREPED